MKGETRRKLFGSLKKPRKFYRFMRKLVKKQMAYGEFAVKHTIQTPTIR